MIEFDLDRIARLADSDPHLDSNFSSFISQNYGQTLKPEFKESAGKDGEAKFTASCFDIRGVSSRPGMGNATLGSERLSNYPTEEGDYEVYRGDPIPLKTYRKMSCDPEIAFGTFLLKGWVGGLPYSIECGDRQIKAIVTHILDGIWKDLVRDMMDSIRNGFAFGEKVWHRPEVFIVGEDDEGGEELLYEGPIASIEKVKFLDPTHSFTFYKRKDEISRVEQQQMRKKVSVPRTKLVWFALDPEYSSIFGRSRYKNIYSDWYYSNVNVKLLLNDLQKRGSPHVEIRFPPGQTLVDGKMVDNGDIAMMLANKMRSDGIVAVPSTTDDNGNDQWSIKYADTKQTTSESPFLDFLKYADQRKMKGLGIPPSVTDAESNFSNADAGGDMLVVVVEDIVNQLEERIQKDVVEDLVDYNFGPKYKSLVKLTIDKSALGRRNLMKEILKTMLRTGSSMQDFTLKAWPDPRSMMNELGILPASFDEIFKKTGSSTNRPAGESAVDEVEDDEGSNDTDGRRDPDDNNRERERDSSADSATESN